MGQLMDLIQEDSAAVGKVELAITLTASVNASPLFVAKQLSNSPGMAEQLTTMNGLLLRGLW